MLMKVKVPTKLRVRAEPSMEGKIRWFLENKTIVDVEAPVNGWSKLNSYWLKDYSDKEAHIKCSMSCYVYAKYLKKCREPKLYG